MLDIGNQITENLMGVYIIRNSKIIATNDYFLSLLGYSLDEIKEIDILNLTTDEYKPLVKNYIEKRTSKEILHVHYRAEIIKKDGTTFLGEIHGVGTTVYGGNEAIIGTIIDVSERQKDKEKIDLSRKQLEHIKGELEKRSNMLVTDINGDIIALNDNMSRMTGYSADELIGQNISILNSGYHPESFFKLMWETLLSGYMWKGEVRNKAKDGTFYWVYLTIVPILGKDGQPKRFLSFRDDITEKKETELKLRQSEEKLRALLEYSYDVIGIMDRDGFVMYGSPSVKQVIGYDVDEIIGENVFGFIHPDELEDSYQFFENILNTPKKPFKLERRLKHKDDSWRVCEIIVTNRLHNPLVNGITYTYRDITERKNSEEKILNMAYFDYLTGLPNRRHFEEKLEYYIDGNKKNDNRFALMFLDLDDFKQLNDIFGHEFGDKMLIEVANRIGEILPKEAFFGRFGGDEFVLILPDIKQFEQIDNKAHEIIHLFEQPYLTDHTEFYISTSIGISVYPYDGEDIKSLLKNSDVAMYRAKEKGKNTYQIYSSNMNENTYQAFTLKNDLRKALLNEEFLIYYQPRIDTVSNEIVSAEALIRWKHPQLGIISPNVFIPLAEEAGLIVRVGEWVLSKVSSHMKLWKKEGLPPIKISVNFSAIQLRQPNLIETIKRIIDEYGINPNYLEVEITESAIIENEERVSRMFTQLNGLGIKIALDDFGTGYSSLTYLKKYKIDILKIDKSLIDQVHSDSDSYEITNAIMNLAKKLNMLVVAEGVETHSQLSLLKKMSCNQIQGYLYSKPVPNNKFVELIKEGFIFPRDKESIKI